MFHMLIQECDFDLHGDLPQTQISSKVCQYLFTKTLPLYNGRKYFLRFRHLVGQMNQFHFTYFWYSCHILVCVFLCVSTEYIIVVDLVTLNLTFTYTSSQDCEKTRNVLLSIPLQNEDELVAMIILFKKVSYFHLSDLKYVTTSLQRTFTKKPCLD